MIYIIAVSTFLSIFLISFTVLGFILNSRQVINNRLNMVAKEEAKGIDSELNQPLFARVVQPLLDNLSKSILKITPKEMVSSLEKKVDMAGNPFKLKVKDWINLQVIIILCLPFISAVLGYIRKTDLSYVFLICLTEIVLGLILPNMILNKQIAKRQSEIRNSMPDVLDLLTVSVEAGLGFDGALAKVVDKVPGALAAEFANVLQEIKVGKHRKDALKDMAERIGIQDLTTFIGSIVQAEQLGVSIGNVLRIQSEQMRQKRRQRAQEKAMKAPVKMLIPMVLFIFPTIFSVLVGPIIIRVIDTFAK
ncbi:MAG TPA: type II secretion system F family protein [Clostridia bacterium]|nr:type II secretion system F family protein [Clostridia bacterium]